MSNKDIVATIDDCRRPGCSRRFAAAALAASLGVLGGCRTFYDDQVEVPGTNQRLIVGSSQVFFGPFAEIWVLENGTITAVKVIKE